MVSPMKGRIGETPGNPYFPIPYSHIGAHVGDGMTHYFDTAVLSYPAHFVPGKRAAFGACTTIMSSSAGGPGRCS